MSNPTLGEYPHDGAERDAVHVAIYPAITGENSLLPGQPVSINKDGLVMATGRFVGIVDPFLSRPVPKGSRVYVCLFPNTVSGMRHHWRHPAFPETETTISTEAVQNDSEIWLRAYAMRMNTYENPQEAFETLIEGLNRKELFAHGTDLHGLYELDDADDLRFHAERYLGITINWGEFEFSCSC